MLAPSLFASVKRIAPNNLSSITRTMNSIAVFLVSILMCSFSMCTTIISLETYDNNLIDSNANDMSIDNLISGYGESGILESVYASQSIGKSHRFYFTQGERKDGDKLLGQVVKQTGWKAKTDATVNITYPADGKNDKKLTFVMLIVYQESDVNRIHVSDGAISDTKMTITINANQTRYLRYDASFYGM